MPEAAAKVEYGKVSGYGCAFRKSDSGNSVVLESLAFFVLFCRRNSSVKLQTGNKSIVQEEHAKSVMHDGRTMANTAVQVCPQPSLAYSTV